MMLMIAPRLHLSQEQEPPNVLVASRRLCKQVYSSVKFRMFLFSCSCVGIVVAVMSIEGFEVQH
jgi:hypothetical protein